MAQYKCIECNIEFEAKHKTMLCPECKSKPLICVVCGKEFPKKYFPYNQKTCSAKCRGVYRAQSGVAAEGAAKMKQTKMDRYGTLDPTQVALKNTGSLHSRICPLCGKEFMPKAVRQIYCEDKHYGPCPACGKLTEIKDYNIGPQACSEKCRIALINTTCLERYGNKDAVNSEHAKELAREHSLAKYGVEYYSQTDEYKQRYKQTSLEKYGVEYPMQSSEVRDRATATCLERYGVTSYAKTDECKERTKKTQLTRFGGIGFQSPQLRERIIATNREKYGCDYSINNPEIRKKAIQSLRKRYGVDNWFSSNERLAQTIVNPEKLENYNQFKANPEEYVLSHFNKKPTIRQLCDDLGVTDTPIYDILVAANCQHVLDHTKQSSMEREMEEFLRSLTDRDILMNTRKVIKPLELDFYLPQYKFAIECNPSSSHNSSVDSWKGQPLPYNYHQIKSDRSQSEGIFLMHVFGYEWEHKRDIMKSMIRNVLGCNMSKIYARKTEVKEIPYKQAKQFLDANHRQGNTISTVRLGLIDKNSGELVSLMTFGPTRPTMGKRTDDSSKIYELSRFCNKLNTSVVGGASKLFSYFVKHYTFDKIISFSDIAHTRGTLYNTLGFVAVSRTAPNYVWVKPYKEFYKNRTSCQKHNLINLFDDVTEQTIKDKSEREIMIEHGFVQVFDSGVIRWEYAAND